MPSKSEKQARTMRAASHDKEFAKKVGIPQDVAKEFVEADKKKKEDEKKKHHKPEHKGKATASKEDHTARASIGSSYRKEA